MEPLFSCLWKGWANWQLVNNKVLPRTFLTLVGGPAAVIRLLLQLGAHAQRFVLHHAGADIATLHGLLIPTDKVVAFCVHDERPVHRVQVAQLRVLLDADGAARHVPQVVQADVLQAGHLEDDQGVVGVEEVASPDDAEVGEQRAEAVQAGHAEQQQVVRDDGQLGQAEGAQQLLVDGAGLVRDEEDLQEALHHGAVLQPLQLADVITDVDTGTADWTDRAGRETGVSLSYRKVWEGLEKSLNIFEVHTLQTVITLHHDYYNDHESKF